MLMSQILAYTQRRPHHAILQNMPRSYHLYIPGADLLCACCSCSFYCFVPASSPHLLPPFSLPPCPSLVTDLRNVGIRFSTPQEAMNEKLLSYCVLASTPSTALPVRQAGISFRYFEHTTIPIAGMIVCDWNRRINTT